MTKVISRHSLKFGGEGRLMLNNRSSHGAFASLGFNGDFTRKDPLKSDSTSGNAFASFLLGYPSSVSSAFNNYPALGQRYYMLFVQDDWRVTEKLTVNLGLRWDYESPITDRFDHQIVGFDSTTPHALGPLTVNGGLIFADSNNRMAFKRDLNNFQPRLGLTYAPSRKLVFRGGWGITVPSGSSDTPPSNGFSRTTSPDTGGNISYTPYMSPGCLVGNVNPTCGLLSNPFPTGILQPTGSSLGWQTSLGGGISYFSHDRVLPYVHSFSAGFQYELPFRTVVDLSYVGSRTRQTATSENYNTISLAQYLTLGSKLGESVSNPLAGLDVLKGTGLYSPTISRDQSLRPYQQYTSVTENSLNLGTSRYDSLQLRLEKRFSAGLAGLFNITYAKGASHNSYNNSDYDPVGSFITRNSNERVYLANLVLTYQLPFFNKTPGLVKTLLGGWQVSGTNIWQANQFLGNPGRSTGVDPRIPNPSNARRFNTCTYDMVKLARQNCASADEPVAWLIQPPYTYNETPDYQLTYWRWKRPITTNLSVFKAFSIRETFKAEIRGEAFNAWNTPIMNGPNTTVSNTSGLFGTITSISQSNDPRAIQLSLRLSF